MSQLNQLRDTFLDLFGLPSNASEEAIKKRYRELVLKLHPDVNKAPNAEDQFRLIQKAYEYLLDEKMQMDMMYRQYKTGGATAKPNQDEELSTEEKRAEMREKAKYYSKKAHAEAQEIEESVFYMLTGNWIWKVILGLASLPVLFGLIMVLDFIVPSKVEMKPIWHMVHHELFDKNTLIFRDNSQIDVPENVYIHVYPGDTVGEEYSSVLHEFLGYQIKHKGQTEVSEAEELSLFFLFPLLPLLFMIPGILFYYKENSVRFYLLYFATCVVYPGLLLHLILKEDKLIYIGQFIKGLF